MFKFTCPHCGRSEYSAAAEPLDQAQIKCVYCGREYGNPHIEEEPKEVEKEA